MFQDTRERNLGTDEHEDYEDISHSKGKVEHVVIFFMHDTNVYNYCDDYHIHFNIKYILESCVIMIHIR